MRPSEQSSARSPPGQRNGHAVSSKQVSLTEIPGSDTSGAFLLLNPDSRGHTVPGEAVGMGHFQRERERETGDPAWEKDKQDMV